MTNKKHYITDYDGYNIMVNGKYRKELQFKTLEEAVSVLAFIETLTDDQIETFIKIRGIKND